MIKKYKIKILDQLPFDETDQPIQEEFKKYLSTPTDIGQLLIILDNMQRHQKMTIEINNEY